MKKNYLKIMSLLILLSSMTESSFAFSVGISGVFSIDDKGLHTGGSAKGTSIDLPNCGGAICNGLESAKNNVTGQREKAEFERERDQLNVEYQNKVNELNRLKSELQRLENQKSNQRESFRQKQVNFTQLVQKIKFFFKNYQQQNDFIARENQTSISNLDLVEKDLLHIKKTISSQQDSFLRLQKNLSDSTNVTREEIDLIQRSFRKYYSERSGDQIKEPMVSLEKSIISYLLLGQSIQTTKTFSEKNILWIFSQLDEEKSCNEGNVNTLCKIKEIKSSIATQTEDLNKILVNSNSLCSSLESIASDFNQSKIE